jgi:hypothetical protein
VVKRCELLERLLLLGQESSTETALFQQRAAAVYGLGITDLKALEILVRTGPQTAGSLAAALDLTTGAVTGVVDRLQRKDMVTREADPDDRRKVIVAPNWAVLSAGASAHEGIGRAVGALHESLTTAELEFLVRYQEQILEITRRERERLAEL